MTAHGRIIELIDANKAKAAFLAPTVLTLIGVVASWVATGDFNENEVRTAISGGILAAAASLATWWQPAGRAEVELEPGSVEELGDTGPVR